MTESPERAVCSHRAMRDIRGLGELLWVLLLLVSLGSLQAVAGDFDTVATGEFTGSGGALPIERPSILPVDEAFRFGALDEESGLTVFWQVLPGYYLYRDKLRFNLNGEWLSPDIREGELRQDEIFGEVQVLEGLVEVRLSAMIPGDEVSVYYQGCAEAGFCYPPQKRQLSSVKKASK